MHSPVEFWGLFSRPFFLGWLMDLLPRESVCASLLIFKVVPPLVDRNFHSSQLTQCGHVRQVLKPCKNCVHLCVRSSLIFTRRILFRVFCNISMRQLIETTDERMKILLVGLLSRGVDRI